MLSESSSIPRYYYATGGSKLLRNPLKKTGVFAKQVTSEISSGVRTVLSTVKPPLGVGAQAKRETRGILDRFREHRMTDPLQKKPEESTTRRLSGSSRPEVPSSNPNFLG